MQRFTLATLALAAALSAPPTIAGSPVVAEGSVAELGILLTLTGDEASVRRDWAQVDKTPQIRSLERARLGDEVTTVILFRGCRPNDQGDCDLRVSFALESPTGERTEGGSGSLWSTKPLSGQWMLGAASATTPVEDDWVAGRYLVEVTVTDRVASRTIRLSVPFEVMR